MAILYIAEFPGRRLGNTEQPVAVLPPLASQAVTFTTTTQSAALGAATRMVRLYSTAACHIVVSADPTATTGSAMKLSADSAEYFEVRPGDKIAAVAA